MAYCISIVEASRNADNVILGVSPRGAINLMKVAKGFAAISDRDYVTPDDVKKAAIPSLSHRLVLSSSAKIKKDADKNIVADILQQVAAPTESVLGWSGK